MDSGLLLLGSRIGTFGGAFAGRAHHQQGASLNLCKFAETS